VGSTVSRNHEKSTTKDRNREDNDTISCSKEVTITIAVRNKCVNHPTVHESKNSTNVEKI